MTENQPDRKGDKIFIEGSYQFNAYYAGRSPQRFWHYTKLMEAQKQAAVTAGDKVLDAGCGSGLLAWFLAKDTTAGIWGIDSNPSAIDFARSRFKAPNLHFNIGMVDELDFPDHFFNAIVFLEVIEHISPAQADKVLRKFYDLLIPGGRLVISTPNKRSAWPLIEFLLDRFRLVPTLSKEQHEYLYTGKELKEKAGQAGFQSTAESSINFISPWIAPISWKWASKMHAFELHAKSKLGSVLVYTFKKPSASLSPT